jgi:hypothetical protein
MKTPSSLDTRETLHTKETVIIYLIAAVLLTGVMVLAFIGWQGQ